MEGGSLRLPFRWSNVWKLLELMTVYDKREFEAPLCLHHLSAGVSKLPEKLFLKVVLCPCPRVFAYFSLAAVGAGLALRGPHFGLGG